ncbi:MAG TPA: molybdenum cofactor guanylyltransferase MobA, partial [Gammaproteobacteria bacterium]|nr:molybdenum cofactor guanylyltransferase MobA [Gammaproteobacteria bacterium]
MTFNARNITIVILAGGRGSRAGGIDKGLMLWQGKPLIEHILQVLPKTSPILINANRNLEQYQRYGYDVVADTLTDYQGPLAGILVAMKHCKTEYLLCMPCDSPQPPQQLAERLWRCLQDTHKPAAICHDGQRLQPLFGLMSLTLLPQLEAWLAGGQRKVELFFTEVDSAVCDFSDQPACFHNFNTAEDMK